MIRGKNGVDLEKSGDKKKAVVRAWDALGWFAVTLVFLLPLKFGMMAGLPEVATAMPSNIMELFYFSWPYFIFSLSSGMLLAGVIICDLVSRDGFKLNSNLPTALSWSVLFLVVPIGFYEASTLDFPLIQSDLFIGFACLALAVHQILARKPELRMWFVNAIVASTLLVALFGLQQYLSGFKETLNYVYSREMANGVAVNPDMLSRLRETRVYSTFSICNSLGAHLLLTLPLCVWAVLSKTSTVKTVVATLAVYLLYASTSMNLTRFGFFLLAFSTLVVSALVLTRLPEKGHKALNRLLLAVFLGLTLFVFRHTNSRGAFLSAGAAILAAAAFSPLKIKTKLIGGGAALLLVIPVLFTDILARSLKSMYFRFDYYLAALKMFAAHPITGVGWGDFFHEYMRIKGVPGSEAPHTPHNFILSFAAQTGIAGLAASLLVIGTPFLGYMRRLKLRMRPDWRETAILAGWLGWCAHSLIDFNIQVPGTVGMATVMLLLLPLNNADSANPDSDSDAGEPRAKIISSSNSKHSFILMSLAAILAAAAITFSLSRWNFESKQTRLMTTCGMTMMGSVEKRIPSNSEVDALLNACVQIAPRSPFPWICAGNSAQRLGEWERSRYFFKEAVKRAPERASAYYHLFLAEMALGDRKAAAENIEKAAELFPNAYAPTLKKFRSFHGTERIRQFRR